MEIKPRRILESMLHRYRNTQFYEVFNWQDELASGRCYVLLASLLSTVITNLVSGVFFTGFLLAAGMDVVEIGSLGCIPFVTAFLNLLTPFALGKYEKRRKVLCVSRLIYYFISVFFMTFVPWIFREPKVVLIMVTICMVVANGVNALYLPGFSAWHVRFLPENVRASFFTYQQVLSGILSAVALIGSGWLSDKVQQMGNTMTFFVGLRMIAFMICIAEVYFYSRPKEYTYEEKDGKEALLAIANVIKTQREYTAVMVVVFLWNITATLTATALDVHVLQVVKIPYTMVTALNASLAVFLLLFAPWWERSIRKCGWLKTLSLATLLHAPFSASIGFITVENFRWLYTISRCAQLICYVGIVIPYSNMPYLALREKDRTACLALFSLVSNFGALSGQMLGTLLMSSMSQFHFTLLGRQFGAISVLMCMQGAGMLLLSGYSQWLHGYMCNMNGNKSN